MNDPASRGHPLCTARTQNALIAHAVLMAHRPFDHIGHGLKPAMGMFGEACDIFIGIIGRNRVQHQKRIKHIKLWRPDGPFKRHTRTIGCIHRP